MAVNAHLQRKNDQAAAPQVLQGKCTTANTSAGHPCRNQLCCIVSSNGMCHTQSFSIPSKLPGYTHSMQLPNWNPSILYQHVQIHALQSKR